MKHIMLSSFAWNKNMEEVPIFDQNHGLTPLEKYTFSIFLLVVVIVYEGIFSF